jgi:asparagine synthase (glutamine-hydrolysing)
MCGISGFQGDFDPGLLDRMNSILAHRGPDDAGAYYDPTSRTGLAHRRLSIIDLSSAGAQPMWDATHTCAITFNGEIYNYRELRQGLVEDGFQFHSQTDTEILLSLYLRDGHEMLKVLNGIFAFAIFDTRDKSLLLARDGFGVKPVYYTQTPKGFLFASELKALLLEPTVSRDLSAKAIHYYLSYLWAPAPWTMLEHVKKLEPGHAMVVRDGAITRTWKFYDIPCLSGDDAISETEAVIEVRRTLDKAVERQMVADVPVGAFLSGGLDSSSICAIARKYTTEGQKLQCFTIDPQGTSDEGFASDLPYSRQMADYLGVDLHVINVALDLIDNLKKMIYHLDEPQADPAAINVLFISSLARDHGIKVLLSGTGSDDIFAGYRRHYALVLEHYWAWLPLSVRRAIRYYSAKLDARLPGLRRLSKAFKFADMDKEARIAGYFHWLDPAIQNGLYSASMKESLRDEPFSEPLMKSLSELGPDTPSLHQMLYLDAKHFLVDHNLNYTDKMSMAVGVETRVPFLDPDLVALAAKLPPRMKQHGRIGKYILRKAMANDLPPAILKRPKTGFGVPLRGWMGHGLHELVNDTLNKESLKRRGLFDPNSVWRLIEMNRAGRIDAAYSIFSLICIEMWCRIFIDGPIGVV